MIALALALIALGAAEAPEPAPPAAPPPPPPGVDLVVRPAAEPRPALRYHLLPERPSLVPGNAATFYHRAILMATGTRANLNQPPGGKPAEPGASVDERVLGWLTGPVAAIPRDEAVDVLARFDPALIEVDLATRRVDCDWAHFERTEGFQLMMPEVQEMRSLVRLVQLRALLAIRDGRVDDAVADIERILVMARHVADGPTLIQGLVGIAFANVAAALLEQEVQAPGAPNLYWALARRPRPLIDLAAAMDWERGYLERELPEIVGIETEIWTVDRARRFADAFDRKIYRAFGGDTMLQQMGVISRDGPIPTGRLTLALVAAQGEAEARRALIAGGMPGATVAAMPNVQAVTLRGYRRFAEVRDDWFKWMNTPGWQIPAHQGPSLSLDEKRANPIAALLLALNPAADSVRRSALGLERRLDGLQCVEAIRLHAHAHTHEGGKLPPMLDALADAPAPIDPTTGRPFEYRVDGDTATLRSPAPRGFPDIPAFNLLYRIKFAR